MRAVMVAIAAIIPALIAVATLMFPLSAAQSTTEPAATEAAVVEAAPRTFLNYVPPPHVRVIKIYGATQDR